MASNLPIPAPPAGTSLALSETKANIAELTKLGLRDEMDYKQAGGMLLHVKHNLKKLEEFEEAEKRPHLDKLQEIRDKYKPMRDDWLKQEKDLKALASKYIDRVNAERAEAQRKLEAEADAKRQRLEKQAAKAEKQGRHEQAASIRDHAEAVVAPVLQEEVPKVAGVNSVETWDFEITNAAIVPKEYWIIDLKSLKKVVQTLKSAAKAIPGIRVFKSTQIRAGSKQPED